MALAFTGITYLGPTSYVASIRDVTKTDEYYTKLEAELENEINNIENKYPGYDDYRITKDSIGHDPQVLLAYLTAKYGHFFYKPLTPSRLREIFKKQYKYEVTKQTEIRRDRYGNKYEYKILEATLTSIDLEEILKTNLNEEETEHFDMLMETKGNFMFYNSPIKGDWKPNMNKEKKFGYSYVDGKIEYYEKMDINVSNETVLAVSTGKILEVSSDRIVLQDNGEKNSKYKIIYENITNPKVVQGQWVSYDDEIAVSKDKLTIQILNHKDKPLNPYFHLYSESKLIIEQFPDNFGDFDFLNPWGRNQEKPKEAEDLEMLFEATAYTSDPKENGGYNTTAMGTALKRGVVAVDPSIIPLGTKLWVEGYGVCRAEDTGGAIQGKRLDLLMDSKNEASSWGRRWVRVAILPDDYEPKIDISIQRQALILEAQKWIGTRYNLGSSNPNSGRIDCSGLTSWAYLKMGITIPRRSDLQYKHSKQIPLNELQPGDLVFMHTGWTSGRYKGVDHVGMYVGDGKIIHAASSGVKVDTLKSKRRIIVGAGRYLPN